MDRAQYIHKRKAKYMAQTLEAFEEQIEAHVPAELAGDVQSFKGLVRARFNALYPYTSAAQRNHVWDECSPISPRARTSTTSVRAYPPVETRTAISGRAKADPSRALSCVVELSPASKNGWWDIVADDAQPSVITPTPHLP